MNTIHVDGTTVLKVTGYIDSEAFSDMLRYDNAVVLAIVEDGFLIASRRLTPARWESMGVTAEFVEIGVLARSDDPRLI